MVHQETMPRFLQAIKIITSRHRPTLTPVVEETFSSPSSFTTALLHELHDTIIKPLLHYTSDKSQSELLFLTALGLAIILFAVILPVYEALFGGGYDDDNTTAKYVCSADPSPGEEIQPPSLKMYKPGVGVVEMKFDSPSLLRMSSDGSGSSSSCSDRSLTGSICSEHCSLETIEESEEEYLQDGDEDEDEGVPQLDTTIIEDDDDEHW